MHDAYDPMGKAEGIKREEYLFLMAQNFALAFHELKLRVMMRLFVKKHVMNMISCLIW